MLIMKTHSIAVLFVVCMGGLFPIESLHAQDFWTVHWLPYNYAVRDLIVDNTGILYVALENSGLYRSTDDGKSFKKLDFRGDVYFRFEKNSKDHIYYGGWGSGLWKSSDQGEHWVKIGLERRYIPDMEVVYDSILFAGVRDEGIFRSSDDGTTWEQVWSMYPSSPQFHFDRKLSALYCLPSGKLFKTLDLGETWSEVLHPWRAEKDTSWVTAFSSNSRGDLFAAVYYGLEEKRTAIIRSTDGGESWVVVGSTREYVHSIVINSLDHVFWVSDPGIPKRSRDNGMSWEDLKEGLDGPRYFRSLALGPDERLYAGSSVGYIAISIQSTVVGAEAVPLPQELSLSKNYPNPAHELTSVSFSLPQAGVVSLTLHNILGERVQTVIGGDHLPPGEHSATFDVSGLPAGVYVLRLHVAGRVVSRVILVE